MILLLPSSLVSLHWLAVPLMCRWVGLHCEAAAHQNVVEGSPLQRGQLG